MSFPQKVLINQHAGHHGRIKSVALLISLRWDLSVDHPCATGNATLLICATSAQFRAHSSQDVTSLPSVENVQRLAGVSVHYLLYRNRPAAPLVCTPRPAVLHLSTTAIHSHPHFFSSPSHPSIFKPSNFGTLRPCQRECPEIRWGMSQQWRGRTMVKQPSALIFPSGCTQQRLFSSHLIFSESPPSLLEATC